MRPTIGVGGVVFRPDGRILLVQRARPPARGQWSLPGGKLKAGERLAAAVTRELLEETRLSVRTVELLEVVEIIEDGFHYVVLDYLCELLSNPDAAAAGDDAAGLQWVFPDDLSLLGASDQVQRVVIKGMQIMRHPSGGKSC